MFASITVSQSVVLSTLYCRRFSDFLLVPVRTEEPHRDCLADD